MKNTIFKTVGNFSGVLGFGLGLIFPLIVLYILRGLGLFSDSVNRAISIISFFPAVVLLTGLCGIIGLSTLRKVYGKEEFWKYYGYDRKGFLFSYIKRKFGDSEDMISKNETTSDKS